MSVYQAVVEIQYPAASGGPGVNVWNHRFGATVPIDSDLANAGDALHAFYEQIKGIYPSGTTIRWDGEWVRLTGIPD